MNEIKGKDPKQILRMDGSSEFLEVMSNCLFSMDKIYINFEKYDKSEAKGQRKKAQIQIYLDVYDAYILAKDICSGRIDKLGKASRKKQAEGGYKYAKHVYQRLGGVSAANLSKRGEERKDKMSLSRSFKITPGSKAAWVISAETGPGEEDKNGLIVPRYKSPEQAIYVPVMTNEDLKKFASAIELMSIAWMTEKIHIIANS